VWINCDSPPSSSFGAACHMDVNHVGLRVIMIAQTSSNSIVRVPPDLGGASGIQVGVLAGQELDGVAGALHLAGEQVDLQIANPQGRFACRNRVTPRQDLEASGQLDELEGLSEIIIAAGAQTRTRSSTADNALRIRTGVSIRSCASVASTPRPSRSPQHPIEHDRVILVASGVQQPLAAGMRDIDVEAMIAERPVISAAVC